MNHFDDLSGFGALNPGNGHNPHNGLGQELTLSDSGDLSPMSAASGHGGSGGGGSTSGHTTAPTPYLVKVAGSNLEIDLIWDSSVASAPTGFMTAVEAAAAALVADFSTAKPLELYIDVGWGEIAGQAMAANALGESQSNGYLVSDSTLSGLLKAHGDTFSATNEPSATTQFFVAVAEARALGLAGATSSASSPDGYVGFSSLTGTGYSWQYNAAGTTATQFNLQAVVQHELTEVMGRVSMEGTATYSGHKTYTPLDLFDFTAQGTLALSNAGGYFSNNNGATQQGVFNNAKQYGGDIADWASYNSPYDAHTLPTGQEDPFNAFSWPGYNDTLSPDDILVMDALGY